MHRSTRRPRLGAAAAALAALAVVGAGAAAAAAKKPATQLVSAGTSGAAAGYEVFYRQEISANGRIVVFQSRSGSLTAGDTNGQRDCFVRDVKTGVTKLVSARPDGSAGQGVDPAMNANGRLVAFLGADGILPDVANGKLQVFVRDVRRGTTTLVSATPQGAAADGGADHPVITPNGRVVGFQDTAADLAPGDENGMADVFVRDLRKRTTTLVTVRTDGTGTGDRGGRLPLLTPNGRFVAFESESSDLVPETQGVHSTQLYVRDLVAKETVLVTVDTTGTAPGNGVSQPVVISENGRVVAFRSAATNLTEVPGSDSVTDIYARDLAANLTVLVSVNVRGDGGGDATSSKPAISANGRFVVFLSDAGNLVDGDGDTSNDLFVRDLVAGTTRRITVPVAGAQGSRGDTFDLVFTPNGRYVAFASGAGDLVPDDDNGTNDVFVHDLKTRRTTLVSRTPQGEAGGGSSLLPQLTRTGKVVAFGSFATDLVEASDTNGATDLFLRRVR